MSNDLIEILKLYHESGVYCSLNDEESDEHIIKRNKYEKSKEYCGLMTPQNNCKISAEKPIDEAQKLAYNCNSIEELKNAVELFDKCEIKKLSRNTVFSDGNPQAKIMLIGEAPGVNEDLEGKPFCGASGKLLDKMLQSINLDRSLVYITNTVFWRPPGNRRPTDDEISLCRPFVEKHIALLSPKILILIGGTACYALLKKEDSISKLRVNLHSYTNQFLENSITTAALFHPAYLLRQPMQKRTAWEDLKKINEFISKNQILKSSLE